MARRGDGKAVEAEEARRGLSGPFLFSYLLAFALIAGLFYRAGAYNIFAVTRTLGILNRTGILPFTDMDTSIGTSPIPLEFHYQTAAPLDWGVLGIAAGILLVVYLLRSVLFHSFARFAGSEAGYGPHARAYLYGDGVNRFFPFRLGNVAAASALEGQGVPLERGALAAYMSDAFLVVEVAVFTLLSWRMLGVTKWISSMIWPFGILLVSYLFVRTVRRRGSRVAGESAFGSWKAVLRAVAQQPSRLLWITIMSLAAFTLETFAAYFVVQALTTTTSIVLAITYEECVVGVLAWHVARRIPITPGGLGAAEWAFTLAMYAAGAGFAASASVVLTYTFIRYVTTGLVFGGVVWGKGAHTNLSRVYEYFKGEGVPASLQGEPVRA